MIMNVMFMWCSCMMDVLIELNNGLLFRFAEAAGRPRITVLRMATHMRASHLTISGTNIGP